MSVAYLPGDDLKSSQSDHGRRWCAGRKGTPMLKVVQENNESNNDGPNKARVSLLDEIVRDGAKQTLTAALLVEVALPAACPRLRRPPTVPLGSRLAWLSRCTPTRRPDCTVPRLACLVWQGVRMMNVTCVLHRRRQHHGPVRPHPQSQQNRQGACKDGARYFARQVIAGTQCRSTQDRCPPNVGEETRSDQIIDIRGADSHRTASGRDGGRRTGLCTRAFGNQSTDALAGSLDASRNQG